MANWKNEKNIWWQIYPEECNGHLMAKTWVFGRSFCTISSWMVGGDVFFFGLKFVHYTEMSFTLVFLPSQTFCFSSFLAPPPKRSRNISKKSAGSPWSLPHHPLQQQQPSPGSPWPGCRPWRSCRVVWTFSWSCSFVSPRWLCKQSWVWRWGLWKKDPI